MENTTVHTIMENTTVHAIIDDEFIARLEDSRNNPNNTLITVPMKHDRLAYQKICKHQNTDQVNGSNKLVMVDVSFSVYDMNINKVWEFPYNWHFIDACKKKKGMTIILNGTMHYPKDTGNCYFDRKVIANFAANTNLN